MKIHLLKKTDFIAIVFIFKTLC